jgi:putative aldouronate transport system permease protein
MHEYYSLSRRIFLVVLTAFFVLLCLSCIVPFFHVLALSFSHKLPATQGRVLLWPLDFDLETRQIVIGLNFKSYAFVFEKPEFVRAFLVSTERVFLAAILTMFVVIMTAYPLSKPNREFKGRTLYVWFLAVTMLISGGLIPWYMIIKTVGMLDSIWALVIPGMAPAFSFLLLLNFYRGLPKSLEESAFLDGAGHWIILWRIYVPLSMPAIATLSLFTIVGNWNAWFDGLILMQHPRNYPLQSYMQTLIASTSLQLMTRANSEILKQISDKTVKSAQIFIGAVPMLLLYPFLQRYFMMGIVLGSVKE